MNILEVFDKTSDEIEKDTKSYEYNDENVIEFIRNSKTATLTFSQGRFVHKIKKLAKENPDEVKIVYENKDGSIVATIPVSYIHIYSSKREMTEEQRKEASERLKKIRDKKNADG
jgi:hypothetical protein